MSVSAWPAEVVHNRAATFSRSYGPAERRIISLQSFERAKAEIASWPDYAPTPLVALDGLANELGIASLHYKDEGHRFGLLSFKALGGAYAVLVTLQKHLAASGVVPTPNATQIVSGAHAAALREITVAAATDGNHGRSVAWGARTFGCRCVIYLHEHVSEDREREIAKLGASIVRVKGHYDDSVVACAQDCATKGWYLTADTSDDADAEEPALVMQGYTLIADEVLAQLPPGSDLPSHVFVQAGVGGLAAAFAAHYWERLGARRPRIVVVEPKMANCVFRSIAAGEPTTVPGQFETVMACLAAGSVSAPAWVIMKHAVDDVVAIAEDAAPAAMRLLAGGIAGGPPIVAGESGCAAVAGLLAVAHDPVLREQLGLTERSHVIVIGSEGATDEKVFQQIVGSPSSAILARGQGAGHAQSA